ncbi:MAG: hypothetical protein D6824_01485 [Planctomycetota bacterium]|nr:MAG: hypothetical protein D6824_01485 [Planctomycetota bacterium]
MASVLRCLRSSGLAAAGPSFHRPFTEQGSGLSRHRLQLNRAHAQLFVQRRQDAQRATFR